MKPWCLQRPSALRQIWRLSFQVSVFTLPRADVQEVSGTALEGYAVLCTQIDAVSVCIG